MTSINKNKNGQSVHCQLPIRTRQVIPISPDTTSHNYTQIQPQLSTGGSP
jgi:hypothetical protein